MYLTVCKGKSAVITEGIERNPWTADFMLQFVCHDVIILDIKNQSKFSQEKKMQSFGQKIRAFRQTREKLLRQAAADLETDQATLSKLENGILLPTARMLQKLSEYYNVPLEELKTLAHAEKIVRDYGHYEQIQEVIGLVKELLENYELKPKEKQAESEKEV